MSKTFFVKTDARQASRRRIQTPPGIERNSRMRKEGYRSVQIRKSAAAALESTAVRLSLSALASWHKPRSCVLASMMLAQAAIQQSSGNPPAPGIMEWCT
jgi:hypothetical protein